MLLAELTDQLSTIVRLTVIHQKQVKDIITLILYLIIGDIIVHNRRLENGIAKLG